MSNKKVWIINQYASTPETGMGGRSFYFAKELATRGYEVYVIAASNHHLLRVNQDFEGEAMIQEVDGVNFCWLNLTGYANAHGLKRIINWFIFSFRLLKLPKLLEGSPDSILFSSPSLIPIVSANRLSSKLGARLIWDIRDLWPSTFVQLGGVSKKHPLVWFHSILEKFGCKNADRIISNWPFAIKHLINLGANPKDFKWIPNGYDEAEFSSDHSLPSCIKQELSKNTFKVGYVGTLGEANALNFLLDAAKLIPVDCNIEVILVGKGRLKSLLESRLKQECINNVLILDAVSKRYVPVLLKEFDVCYVGFNKSPLYEYGNSLNKLPEYLMSGKPIIYSINSSFEPISDANAGITVEAENPEAIKDAIVRLYNTPEHERDKLGTNGIDYAERKLNYKILVDQLVDILFD